MFENVEFNHRDGVDSGYKLKFFGLTTCAYCKRAIEFLEENGFEYDYIYLDKHPLEVKSSIKNEFKEQFGVRMSFPVLLFDDKDYLIGFIKVAWDDLFERNRV